MSDTSDLIILSPRAPSPRAPSPCAPIPTMTATSLPRAKKAVEQVMEKKKPDTIVQTLYGGAVVITPLPKSITKRDILCRIRGGKVLSCTLSEFRGCPVAIVVFYDPASAQHYVDFCAESFNKELWTFPAGPDFVPPSHVDITSRVNIYKDAPGLGVTWHPEDIPGRPQTNLSSITRCLYINNCHVEEVAGIWVELGLDRSHHLRDQLEDMWLGRPRWDDAAGKASGTLHVWFSSINNAMKAQRRCPRLKYEADPCSRMPQESFVLGLDDPEEDHKHDPEYGPVTGPEEVPKDVYLHHHSFPFVSVLDLHKTSLLSKVHDGLMDPYEVFWCVPAPPTEEEKFKAMGLTNRLMHVLRTNAKPKRNPSPVPHHGSPIHIRIPAPIRAGIYPHGPPVFEKDPFTDGHDPSTSVGAPGYAPASRPQRSVTHHNHTAPPPNLGPLSSQMARPQSSHCPQFPPRMGGENPAAEHPYSLERPSSPESPVQAHIARRRGQHGSAMQREPLPWSHPVGPSSSIYEGADYQSGCSAGNKHAQGGDASQLNDTAALGRTSQHSSNTACAVKDPPPAQQFPNYSRENWNHGRRPVNEFWTVSLEEFLAMSNNQWKAFGTCFYIPPPGFNTAKKHVLKLE